MEEFNLSDCIEMLNRFNLIENTEWIRKEKVKEFIKKLLQKRYNLDIGYPEDAGSCMVQEEDGEFIKEEDLYKLTGELK